MKEFAQLGLAALDSTQFGAHAGVEFAGLVRRKAGEPRVLEPAPERLDRVKHGRVGGQAFQAQTSGVFAEKLHAYISARGERVNTRTNNVCCKLS